MKTGTRPVKFPAPDCYKQPKTNQQQCKCFRCGSTKHLANDKNCPAAAVKCNKCRKKGHFAKVCKSAVSEVREVVVPELAVLCVDDVKLVAAAFDKITCTINIEAPQGNSHALELH